MVVGWSIVIRRQLNLIFSVSANVGTMSGEDIVLLHQDFFILLFFEWAEGGVCPVELIKEFRF